MDKVINTMHKKKNSEALLDVYACSAATKKDLFAGEDIQLNRLIQYKTGCALVLSGNMAWLRCSGNLLQHK